MKDYKKILEGVVSIINTAEKSDIGFANICSYIGEKCPELKESNDEKIRKKLIDFIKSRLAGFPQCEKFIAWLKNKGEQKSIDDLTQQEAMDIAVAKCFDKQKSDNNDELKDYSSIDPDFFKTTDKAEQKFHEGEWITNGDYTWKIIEVKPLDYILQSQDGNIVDDTISHVDEQFHSFTIEDAKDGNVLVASDGSIFLFAGVMGCDCKHYVALKTYGDVKFNEGLKYCWENSSAVYPATKEQYDALKKAIADAGYTFDFEKKELKKIEEEINGEDYGIDSLYHAQRILEKTLGKVDGYQSDDGILEHKCAISAVKKLYKQNTWKSTEE